MAQESAEILVANATITVCISLAQQLLGIVTATEAQDLPKFFGRDSPTPVGVEALERTSECVLAKTDARRKAGGYESRVGDLPAAIGVELGEKSLRFHALELHMLLEHFPQLWERDGACVVRI